MIFRDKISPTFRNKLLTLGRPTFLRLRAAGARILLQAEAGERAKRRGRGEVELRRVRRIADDEESEG